MKSPPLLETTGKGLITTNGIISNTMIEIKLHLIEIEFDPVSEHIYVHLGSIGCTPNNYKIIHEDIFISLVKYGLR